MIAQDPAGCLQHYPLSMRRFGLNPYGENKFRIILASTRRHICYGKMLGSGSPRAYWIPTYPHLGSAWVIEEWRTPFQFTGMTPEAWNKDPEKTILGPYPDCGEYQMIWNGPINPGDHSNIEAIIASVHAGEKYSAAERFAAIRQKAEYDELQKQKQCRDIIWNSFPAFDGVAFSQTSTGGKSAKTSPVMRTAREAGLPVPKPGKPGEVRVGSSRVMTA